MTILVTGTFDLDPDKSDEFAAAASACMAATRDEAACESYAFTRDLEVPGRFHVTELWASQEGMDEHMASRPPRRLHGRDGRLRHHRRVAHPVERRHRRPS